MSGDTYQPRNSSKTPLPVRVWREEISIPTYGVGTPDRNPMFLEKRVYQGSSGAVYPWPIVDRIGDDKSDRRYQAIFLENEFLKIMILPELGGPRSDGLRQDERLPLRLLQSRDQAGTCRFGGSLDQRRDRVQLAAAPSPEHVHAGRWRDRGRSHRRLRHRLAAMKSTACIARRGRMA